jgi:hypothetical protein
MKETGRQIYWFLENCTVVLPANGARHLMWRVAIMTVKNQNRSRGDSRPRLSSERSSPRLPVLARRRRPRRLGRVRVRLQPKTSNSTQAPQESKLSPDFLTLRNPGLPNGDRDLGLGFPAPFATTWSSACTTATLASKTSTSCDFGESKADVPDGPCTRNLARQALRRRQVPKTFLLPG